MLDLLSILQLILFASAGGGGNDLLDYLPGDAYWDAKDIVVSPETMLRELQPVKTPSPAQLAALVNDVGSDDHARAGAAREALRQIGLPALPALAAARDAAAPASSVAAALMLDIRLTQKANEVRRLMAIRTLGALRAKESVATLQTLSGDGDYFVADYAKAALATIEGRPPDRARAPWTDRDVWLMPSRLRAVAGYAPRPPPPISIDAAIKRAALPKEIDRETLADALAQRLVPIAEQFGNIRFDAITVGASGDLSDHTGFVVFIVRGRYDREAASELLSLQKVPSKTIDGMRIYAPDQETAFLLPSDDRLVIVASPRGKELPTEEIVAGLHAMSGGLRQDAEMARLITSVGTTAALWGAVKMTDDYRRLPLLSALDRVTFVGHERAPGALTFLMKADGSDASAVRSTADAASAGIAEMRKQLNAALGAPDDQTPPPVRQAMQDFVQSVHITVDGKSAALTGTLDGPRDAMLERLLAVYAPLLASAPPER